MISKDDSLASIAFRTKSKLTFDWSKYKRHNSEMKTNIKTGFTLNSVGITKMNWPTLIKYKVDSKIKSEKRKEKDGHKKDLPLR